MDDFKKITEQLFKIYINAESVNDLGLATKIKLVAKN